MTTDEAVELIRDAVLEDGAPVGRSWADLGAGSGTFAFALADVLGSEGRVVAVDREEAALESLRQNMTARREGDGARIVPVHADFRDPGSIPELRDGALDGAFFGNALHFDPDPSTTLERTGALLSAGGRIVVVEYQDRPLSPWVPHPLPVARLEEIAAELGVRAPRVVGERPSSYGGILYCAWLEAS